MRKIALGLILLAALSGQPQPSPSIVHMQRASGNAALCPVCRSPATLAPVELVISGKGGALDGSTLSLPVMVCPRDGVLFAVRP